MATLNARNFNRKKFDDHWMGIVLPQSSQERQMGGFGGFSIRRKVAIMGHTPSNRGEIDDKDVVFAIVAVAAADGSGGGNRKRTPRISQGDVVYGIFLDKDTKQTPIILGILGRTSNVTYEKGVYGRYDITSGFVGQTQPLKLLGRGQTNEDDKDCSPLSIPFEDAMKAGAQMLSEKGGVPTEPTVGAIPPPPTDGEGEVDPDIDEKIKNAENNVQELEDKKKAFDAQESASEGSIDSEAYEENQQKLDDAQRELDGLKETKNKNIGGLPADYKETEAEAFAAAEAWQAEKERKALLEKEKETGENVVLDNPTRDIRTIQTEENPDKLLNARYNARTDKDVEKLKFLMNRRSTSPEKKLEYQNSINRIEEERTKVNNNYNQSQSTTGKTSKIKENSLQEFVAYESTPSSGDTVSRNTTTVISSDTTTDDNITTTSTSINQKTSFTTKDPNAFENITKVSISRRYLLKKVPEVDFNKPQGGLTYQQYSDLTDSERRRLNRELNISQKEGTFDSSQ